MILSLEGEESVGKTTLAYSAPLPIVGFGFDLGAERAIYGGRFKELFEGLRINMVPYTRNEPPSSASWQDSDITIFELPPPIQLDSIRVKGCHALWNYFIQALAEVVVDPLISSIVIDTMTVARRIKADAYLESLQDKAFDTNGIRKLGVELRERLLQIEWGQANDPVRNIYTTCAGVKKNLIAVHHLTDEYKEVIGRDGKVETAMTGNRKLEGLSQTYRFVDVAIRMSKSGGIPSGKLHKCGYNMQLEGTMMESPSWDSIVDLIALGSGERIQLERRAKAQVSS